MIIRLGLPEVGGELVKAAAKLGGPVLVSASRLWNGQQRRFRQPSTLLQGLDCAEDSAGFTAMSTWKGYPWTPAQYVKHANSWPSAWFASMDKCCEPEIASDRSEVLARVVDTAKLLQQCRSEAAQLEARPPMPVLQGWRPEDYRRSIELTDRVLCGTWPELIGVGSVCRRPEGGKDGLWKVVAAIHRHIPAHVKLHLFGVKSKAARRGHPRVVSVDSMAWDFDAREEIKRARRAQAKRLGYAPRPKDPLWLPCDTRHRIARMHVWHKAQHPEPGRQLDLMEAASNY